MEHDDYHYRSHEENNSKAQDDVKDDDGDSVAQVWLESQLARPVDKKSVKITQEFHAHKMLYGPRDNHLSFWWMDGQTLKVVLDRKHLGFFFAKQ